MWKRKRKSPTRSEEFPPELIAEARANAGGWVYVIDPAYAPEGADGTVPPEGIVGAWEVGKDGILTGKFERNDNYSGDVQPPT